MKKIIIFILMVVYLTNAIANPKRTNKSKKLRTPNINLISVQANAANSQIISVKQINLSAQQSDLSEFEIAKMSKPVVQIVPNITQDQVLEMAKKVLGKLQNKTIFNQPICAGGQSLRQHLSRFHICDTKNLPQLGDEKFGKGQFILELGENEDTIIQLMATVAADLLADNSKLKFEVDCRQENEFLTLKIKIPAQQQFYDYYYGVPEKSTSQSIVIVVKKLWLGDRFSSNLIPSTLYPSKKEVSQTTVINLTSGISTKHPSSNEIKNFLSREKMESEASDQEVSEEESEQTIKDLKIENFHSREKMESKASDQDVSEEESEQAIKDLKDDFFSAAAIQKCGGNEDEDEKDNTLIKNKEVKTIFTQIEKANGEKITIEYPEALGGGSYEGKFNKLCLKHGHGVEKKINETYSGFFKNGARHGQGILTLANGDIYKGNFRNGLCHGEVIITYNDEIKSIYDGGLKNGKLCKGLMIYKNGDQYYGVWQNDMWHGEGKITYQNGDIYEGNFASGKKTEGKLIKVGIKGAFIVKYNEQEVEEILRFEYPDGTKYEPESTKQGFQGYQKHGKGKLTLLTVGGEPIVAENTWENDKPISSDYIVTYKDKSKYIGNFVNGKKEGIGTITYLSGNTYSGAWKDDQKSGEGKMIYFNKGEYEGAWKNDLRCGEGKMIYSNGNKYEGTWKNDLRCGKGKLIQANEEIYDGGWDFDHKHGDAITQKQPDGEKCHCKYQKGLKHGMATYYKGDIKIREENWDQGRVVLKQKNRCVGKSPERENAVELVYFDTNYKDNKDGWRTLANGNKYKGEIKNNRAHGTGTMQCTCCGEYTGDWQDGAKHGKGIMRFKNGDKYDGEWQNGVIHGKGTMRFKNGDKYDGEWQNGVIHGQGEMTYKDGQTYNGEWLNGERHGKGTMKCKCCGEYIGYWQNGVKHGKGAGKDTNGDKYDGYWVNDEGDGNVKITFKDGSTYEGQWKNSVKHGKGIFKNIDGSWYKGSFENDVYHGEGEMGFSDGQYYKGQWKDGKGSGYVEITCIEGIYKGQWQNGVKNGIGVFKETNDTWWYNGMFKNDDFHGPGKMGMSNGNIYDGNFIKGSIHGQGTMIYKSGDVYTGQWEKYQRHGQGIMIYKKNGDVYTGQWKQNQRHGQGELKDKDGLIIYSGLWEKDEQSNGKKK